jgi:hypothetical protein
VNTLTQEVSILHERLKELGELLEVEECTPAECEALLRARKTLFELEDEVCQVLYAIKGRSEEYRERLARSIRDAVDDIDFVREAKKMPPKVLQDLVEALEDRLRGLEAAVVASRQKEDKGAEVRLLMALAWNARKLAAVKAILAEAKWKGE